MNNLKLLKNEIKYLSLIPSTGTSESSIVYVSSIQNKTGYGLNLLDVELKQWQKFYFCRSYQELKAISEEAAQYL